MSYWTGPCFLYTYFLQKNGGEGCHTGQDLVVSNLISYKRMEGKDVILDRTLFSLHLFPTKEWRKRMSYRTGPRSFTLISYKRMEEKDVIVDRTLSIIFLMSQRCDGTDLLSFDWY